MPTLGSIWRSDSPGAEAVERCLGFCFRQFGGCYLFNNNAAIAGRQDVFGRVWPCISWYGVWSGNQAGHHGCVDRWLGRYAKQYPKSFMFWFSKFAHSSRLIISCLSQVVMWIQPKHIWLKMSGWNVRVAWTSGIYYKVYNFSGVLWYIFHDRNNLFVF